MKILLHPSVENSNKNKHDENLAPEVAEARRAW